MKRWQVDISMVGNDSVPDHLQDLAYDQVCHYVRRLDIHRFGVHLKVFFEPVVCLDDTWAAGYCTRWSAREFSINLALYNNWCVFLAHELVHVKQHLRGDVDPVYSQWRGIPVMADWYRYQELPWEQEAFQMQWQLAQGYYTL